MKPSSIVPPVKRYSPRSGIATSDGDDADARPCAAAHRGPAAAARRDPPSTNAVRRRRDHGPSEA